MLWLKRNNAQAGYCLMHITELDAVQRTTDAQQKFILGVAKALGPFMLMARGDLAQAAEMVLASKDRAEKALRETLTWRPMDSAPKDGTIVLGRFKIETFQGMWPPAELYQVQPMMWNETHMAEGDWLTPEYGNDRGELALHPNSWVPMPEWQEAAPAEPATEGPK